MMKFRKWVLVFACLLAVFTAAPTLAQDDEDVDAEVVDGDTEEAEGSKELRFAGSGYPYYGPDTGLAIGFSMLYRDMFDKKGRDLDFSISYTQTGYLDYGVTWQEPYFLSEQGRLKLNVSFSDKPVVRFNGIGNDTRAHNDSCNYEWDSISFSTTYIHRFPKTDYGIFGLRFGVGAQLADPGNGEKDEVGEGSAAIPIKKRYPEIYNTDDFDANWLIGPTITFYRDTRVDRFPLGGGREEVVWPLKGGYEEISYTRIDEAFGSNLSYNSVSVDLRQIIPLFNEDTTLAMRVKGNFTQGEVPFYNLPGFGGGSDLRGYYGKRFNDENSTQLQVELRQGFLPDYELPVLGGLVKLKYPSIALYWEEGRVYDDYATVLDEILEDYHYTYGVGFRFIITPTIVIRLDYAWSKEQTAFHMTSGLPI